MSDGAANANCNSDTQQQQQQEQQQHQQLHTKPVWQSTMKIGNSTASLQSHLHSPSTPEIEGMHSAKKKKKRVTYACTLHWLPVEYAFGQINIFAKKNNKSSWEAQPAFAECTPHHQCMCWPLL